MSAVVLCICVLSEKHGTCAAICLEFKWAAVFEFVTVINVDRRQHVCTCAIPQWVDSSKVSILYLNQSCTNLSVFAVLTSKTHPLLCLRQQSVSEISKYFEVILMVCQCLLPVYLYLHTKQEERVNNIVVFIRESLANQDHPGHLDPLDQPFP